MKTSKSGAKTTPPAKKKTPEKKEKTGSGRSKVKAAARKAVKSPVKKAATKPAKAPAKKTASKTVKKAVKSAVKKAVSAVRNKVSSVVANFKKKSAAKKAKAAEVKTAKAAPTVKKASSKKVIAKVSTAPAKTAAKTESKPSVKPSSKPAPAKAGAPKSKRPKAFTPADVARGFGFPADAPELPASYGEDRLVLMSKDPEYLFAYWEITPERHATGEKAKHAGEEYREALRLNWVARDLFDANYALMPVSLGARKWYLRVPYSGIAYQIEIGWLGSQGHFISLLTSNPSDAPESWTATRKRLKGAAGKDSVLSRTLRAGRPQGSSEQAPVHSENIAVPAGDWNFGGPGSLDSSFGKNGAAKAPAAVKPAGKRR